MRIKLRAGDCHHPRDRFGIVEQRPSDHRFHHPHLTIGRTIIRRVATIAAPATRTRVAVKIVDAAGNAVPQARIEMARKGRVLRLVSGADAAALFTPSMTGSLARP